MKQTFLSLILSLSLLSQAWGATLFAPVHYQERSNWDWAALCQTIFDVYGLYITQTEIATWATPTNTNTGTHVYGFTTVPDRKGIDLILAHFKSISTTYFARSLTEAEVASYISQGKLIVAGKGNGIDIIFGYTGGYVSSISPWPGFGAEALPYSTYLNEYGYSWQETLIITTPRPARPTRYIVESTVPRTYATFAVDKLTINDGVKVYANATTTTSYGAIGSGWYNTIPNLFTNGINLGAYANVGTTTSTGPVLMRSNSVINGNLTMLNTSTLSQQAGARVTGSTLQQTLPYPQPAFGSNEFAGVAKTTINIEPDQARRYLSPGSYWIYNIKQRSPVRLRAGDYFFKDLNCDGCTFEVDASAGPVRVYVSGTLLWTGKLTYVAGATNRFMLAYLGKETTYINGFLDGTIIAPDAHLVLGQSSSKTYTGMYIARDLTVHQYSVIRYRPFTFE